MFTTILGMIKSFGTVWGIRIVEITSLWIFVNIFTKRFDKFVSKKFTPLLKKLGINRRKLNLIDTFMDISIYTLAIVITLYVLELTTVIYTVLTAAGVMGIVIGFGVQEITKNLISGILIKLNQPFIEGDSISVDNKYKGTVTNISMYYTDMVDYQGIVTSIPNSQVISKTLTNYSKQSERLINIKLAISKDNNIEKAIKVLKDLISKDESKLENRDSNVFMDEIKEYSVVLTLRFWVDMKDFSKTKRRITKNIALALKKNKIELAVPLRKNV